MNTDWKDSFEIYKLTADSGNTSEVNADKKSDIVPTDLDSFEGGKDNVQLLEEFFASMNADEFEYILETMFSGWSELEAMVSITNVEPVDVNSFEKFLEAMATDWCALNETLLTCPRDEPVTVNAYAKKACSTDAPIDRDVELGVESILNHSAGFSFATNPGILTTEKRLSSSDQSVASSTNFSTGLKFVVNPGIGKKTVEPTSSTALNHSRYIKNAYVNPHYLRFIANIKIRYETTSSVTTFPTNLQHSLLLKVLPKDTFQAHTSPRKVLDVHCTHHDGMLCNRSYTDCYQAHTLDCQSTAQYWIGFDSLLKGLGDAELNRYKYFVPRTVRFVLFRESESSSAEVVDWWDLTANVPLESDHERWMLGHYKSSYTVKLEGNIVVKPELLFASQKVEHSWNQTLPKSVEIEDQLKVPQQNRSSSESHNESESQGSAWEKLLYGCLSGLVAGLGVLTPFLGPEFIRSVVGDKKDAASSSVTDACKSDRNYASPARPSPVQHSSNASPFVKDTIEHAPFCQRQPGAGARNFDAGTDNSNDGSSLPPIYPKQDRRKARKKMYLKRFGIGSDNSATPRRCNLSSNQAKSAQTEASSINSGMSDATCEDSEASIANTHSHAARENRESIFYSPQFDTDMPDSWPHSNTLSFQEELVQHEQQNTDMEKINESYSRDAGMDRSNTSEVSKDDRETYSPPTIERIIDPIPFANLPPFPASKVTLERHAEQGESQSQEKSAGIADRSTQEEAQAQSPTLDTNELLNEEDGHHADRNIASAVVADQPNKNEDVESQNETAVLTSSTALECIAPNSPVTSDASPTFDNNKVESADSESKVENEVASNTKSAVEFSSHAMPCVPSPRKRTRRSSVLGKRQASSSQSPVSTVGETAAGNPKDSVTKAPPMTVDRPFARSCGAPGQSKKFASSPASDELSFKSGSTFHDCGGERIGQRVAKVFNGFTVFGTVTEYDGRDSPEIWRVCYDDGSTHKEYCKRHELTDAILHYQAHKANDPSNAENIMMANLLEPHSQQTSESQESDSKSDDTWTRKEKKARDKKRARAERRLLRSAKKPAIHKPASALIPLSQAIDEPVWEFSRKRKSI
jgi:hypothetical protein